MLDGYNTHVVKKDPINDIRVLTNGCFDLFHAAHKRLIEYTLMLGNRGTICILVNSDKSIKALKGPGRPVDSSTIRIQNIRKTVKNWKLTYRTYPTVEIHLFDTEEELRQQIDLFAPDVIIKGNDRPDIRDVVGSDKWPVLILPRLKNPDGSDISTTNLLQEPKDST